MKNGSLRKLMIGTKCVAVDKIAESSRMSALSTAPTMVLALLGLLAYAPGLQLLGSIHPQYIPMAPSTAISFLILSIALFFVKTAYLNRVSKTAFVLVALVSLFGFLEVIGFLVDADLNFEDFILPEFGYLGSVQVGRMSPATGLFFILAGVGLLAAYIGQGWQGGSSASTLMPGIIGMILIIGSLVFLLGYLFGTPMLYDQKIIPMALTTGTAFFFLGLGLVQVAGGKAFPLNLFSGTSAYARLMRSFIPLSVGVILASSVSLHFTQRFIDLNDALTIPVLAVFFSSLAAVLVHRVARSVGERMEKNERELLLSRERYRSLFNSIRDAILVADTSRRIVDCNPAFLDLFGYSKEECLGRPTVNLYADEENFSEIGEKLRENLGSHGFLHTIYYRRRSGEIFPGETNVFYLRDAENRVIGFIGLIRDITLRIQAEEDAAKSRDRLNSLVDNLFEGLVVTDGEGSIRFVNPAACRLLGREKSRLLGAPFGFPVASDEMFEIAVNTPEGKFRYAEARATVTDWEGEASQLISLRDVTERRLAAKEREEMNAHLQKIQRIESIGTLAGGIAHDFNNILSPILGFTELAMEQVKEDSVAKERMEQVYQSALRAKDLVKQILAFSRQRDAELHPMQVAPIVKEVLKMLRSTLPATIEIREKIDSEKIIWGDASGIHQILMNLCTNAKYAVDESEGVLSVWLQDIEATPEESKGQAELEAGRYYVLLGVEDNGCGIEPAIMEKIFEPYFTTKHDGQEQGTGLGLSVVHGIVKNHGGAINVSSRLGEGTVFEVYLPCSNGLMEEQKTEIGEPEQGSEHILFVDDEPVMVQLNQQILESLGYRVSTRTSSLEALELFKSKPNSFDLLITDLTMPHMTGDKLALECKHIRPGIPVILATGFSEKISPQGAKKKWIDAFVYKPVQKTDLAGTIRELLDDTSGGPEESKRVAHRKDFK
jgi:PAS domain S-box-containing protein